MCVKPEYANKTQDQKMAMTLFVLLYGDNSVWTVLNHWSLSSQTSCLVSLQFSL